MKNNIFDRVNIFLNNHIHEHQIDRTGYVECSLHIREAAKVSLNLNKFAFIYCEPEIHKNIVKNWLTEVLLPKMDAL